MGRPVVEEAAGVVSGSPVDGSSSLWMEGRVATDSSMTTMTTTPATTFEPVLPEPTVLIGFGVIVLLTALAVWVWAYQVVPVSRTNLALDKKRGPLKDYLDELQDSAATAPPTTNLDVVSSNATDSIHGTTVSLEGAESSAAVKKKDRALERWLFADWLHKGPAVAGRQKEPALPVLKQAKWNSGDNPVLAATALILLGVVLTSTVEQISTMAF